MNADSPFAQMPATPEPIIAQVRRQLASEELSGHSVPASDLDRIAAEAVQDLWGSRIKTFVPVLALRQARDLLHGHWS